MRHGCQYEQASNKSVKTAIVDNMIRITEDSALAASGTGAAAFVKRLENGRWTSIGFRAARTKVSATFRNLLGDKYLSSSTVRVQKRREMKKRLREKGSGSDDVFASTQDQRRKYDEESDDDHAIKRISIDSSSNSGNGIHSQRSIVTLDDYPIQTKTRAVEAMPSASSTKEHSLSLALSAPLPLALISSRAMSEQGDDDHFARRKMSDQYVQKDGASAEGKLVADKTDTEWCAWVDASFLN